MKLTALHIERWLDDVEARIVPPERPGLRVIIHELREGESREKAFAELVARYPQNVAGKTVDDLIWSDDLVGAQEKAVAEHIAAHPEDAGRTVKDFRWVVWEIVRKPQELPQELFEDELTAKDTMRTLLPPRPTSTFCHRLTLVASLARSHGDPCINFPRINALFGGTGVGGMGEW
jgi:hypothetical protein